MTMFHQTGRCQCGQVRYTLTKQPEVIYCCHCTECQKQSSSAFGISVRVETDELEISGQCANFSRTSKNGDAICEFCPSCGTRLFHRRASYAHTLNIKGGTFDDTSWIKPAGHIWVRSKQNWLELPKNTLVYEEQPDNYEALTAAYQRN